MKKRTLLFIGFIILCMPFIYAQDQEKTDKDCNLEMMQRKIKDEVKEELKDRIKTINKKIDKGEITQAEAEKQKKALAEQKAKNIEERQAIARLFFQYAQRNNISSICEIELPVTKDHYEDWVDRTEDNESGNKYLDWLEINSKEDDSEVYDRLIVSFGTNTSYNEGDFLENPNYDTSSSRYFEIGWEWSHKVLDQASWLRVNYGFSFQFNGFKQDNDLIFVENGDQTELQDSGRDLDKSKFRMTNLILPLHLEFNIPRTEIDEEDGTTYKEPAYKLGLGGFTGLNIGNMQKIKYDQNGNDFKLKERDDFNVDRFLYGLSTYIGFDDIQLFGQYNLNPVFSNNPIDEHNFQLGVRLELGE